MVRGSTIGILLATSLAAAAGVQEECVACAATATLAVSGTGEVGAAPDMAEVDLGVTSEAPTAAEALAANSDKVRGLLAALENSGVDAADVQTRSFSVSPVYEQPRERDRQPPQVVGYRVSNQVHVRVRDLASLGALLDRVVQAGANDVNGIRFGLSDPAPLEDRARRLAVQDAARKARVLADEAGLELGPVLEIREGAVSRGPQPMMMAFAEARAAVPIAEGEETLTTTVEIVYGVGVGVGAGGGEAP